MLPTSASFLVTENCNLACTYCFEKHKNKTMSVEVAKKALEMLCDNAVKSGKGSFHAMLFGGEPLLNIDLIDKIFHMGEELAEKNNVQFSTSMVTNATVMNDEIFDVLKWHRDRSNLSVQLSIDGTKEVQDRYRITKGGKGSFDLVEKNIPKFKELFSDCMERLCIHGCVNHDTMPKLFESYHFFKYDLGFKNIWFLPVAEEAWTKEDVEIYDEQNRLIYEDIMKDIKEAKDAGEVNKILHMYAPMDRCFFTGRSDKPCGAGDSFVTISAEGEIYPCHQIYFNDPEKEAKIGDLENGLDEDARRVYVEYDNSWFNCKKDCENDSCYRCLAANFVANGSMFSQIKGIYCDLMTVDKKYQKLLRNEGIAAGVIRESTCNCKPAADNCLCNSRQGISTNGCDVVHRQENCESGNNPDNPDCLCDLRTAVSTVNSIQQGSNIGNDEEFKDLVANALVMILEKLETIEKALAQKE